MNRSHLTAWVLTIGSLSVLCVRPIAAQIVPDNTLSVGDRSQVSGNANVQIDGGARRGGNLFHSFSQFSIPTGGSAYFNNAATVQNIFSRVTGGSVSNIDGLIRADGTANLFLLNPNGILFGPNASLNLGGSFFASTGDRFQFADGSEFSAVNPQAPPLLTVNVTLGLQVGRNAPNATISNQGNLAVAQDLTLAADRLELQGQLQAGRDLSLLAQNTVQVRDSPVAPFLAQAGRDLTIQGNQGIDLLALNHPSQPAFVSGSNLSLISDGVISGDAQFASGSRFSIRGLSGDLANFVSLYDPIISARGDVDVAANYTGASLLVESQGSIRFQGNITITQPDAGTLLPGSETDILRNQSALIVRSGQSTLTYGSITGLPTTGSNVLPSGITLNGTVVLQPFNGAGGTVRLLASRGSISTQAMTTNGGAIDITSAGSMISNRQSLNTTNEASDGGNIAINANGDISINTLSTNTSASRSSTNQGNSGNAGNITLNTTNGNISTGFISATSSSSARTGRGGDVTISTANGSINTNNNFIFAFSYAGSGDSGGGGNITLSAANGNITASRLYADTNTNSGTGGQGGNIAIRTTNGNIEVRRIQSASSSSRGGTGNSGTITINAVNGSVVASSMNSTATSNAEFSPTRSIAAGNGGAITVIATNGNISTDRITSYVSAGANAGDGGAIRLVAPNGSISTASYLYSGSSSAAGLGGRGGDITLLAAGTIQPYQTPEFPGQRVNSTINSTSSLGSGNITIESQAPFVLPNFLISSDTFGSGRGGDIQITALSILLTNASQISASTHSSGQGGNITLRAADSIQFSGSTTVNPFGTNARSGFATLPTGTYSGGYIPTGSTVNDGQLEVPVGTVFPTGAFTQTTVGATGSAGNLILETGRLVIQDGAALATTTFGQNSNAGGISVRARDSVVLTDGRILSGVAGGAIGNSGGITINTPSLVITEGAIQTQTLGQGRAGDIQITAPSQVNLSGSNSNILSGSGGSNALLGRTSNNIGAGGNIRVTTVSLNVADGATLSAQTQTNARGGNIIVDADRLNLVGSGQLLTSTSSNGRAGDITVNTPNLQLSGANSGLFAGTTSAGEAGNLTIQPRDNGQSLRVNLQDGAQISASTSSSGRGGQLTIAAPESITLTGNGSIIAAGTGGSGAGGDLRLQTNTLSVQDQAGVTVSSSGTGKAGALFVDANRVVVSNGGSIRAGTSSAGQGGQLTIAAPNSITLTGNGSVIAAGTEGSGAGGNLNLRTGTLNIQNQAEVTVSSTSTGSAGSLFVDADRIYLSNQGSIRADTTGGGGNIDLRSPFILLRNGSNITTNATGNNILGGNIAINTQFLIAVPREDSNISANSEDFRGGNVNINAFSIFGIQPRPSSTSLSDITATGATFALSGTIDITTAGIDPTSGLVALPTDLVDSAPIAQGCAANQGNSFVITGRGGLPPTPEQQLDDDAEWGDRRRLTVAPRTSPGRERTENRKQRTDTLMIEATGWQITSTGAVFLVATTPDPTVQNRLPQPVACQRK